MTYNIISTMYSVYKMDFSAQPSPTGSAPVFALNRTLFIY